MNEFQDVEHRLARWMEAAAAGPAPKAAVEGAIAVTSRMRPWPRWRALIGEPSMRRSSRVAVGSPVIRLTSMAAITMAGLAGVAAGAVLLSGLRLSGPSDDAPMVPGWSGQPSPSAKPVIPPDRGTFSLTGAPADESPVGITTAAIAVTDGRVLVQHDGTAEVWDPDTQAFLPTGSLAENHYDGTLIGLEDGRVMVAGGIPGATNDGPTTSAELWDPASGEWHPTGPMGIGRTDMAWVPLPGGRVLVAGGSAGRLRTAKDPTGADVWEDPALDRTAEIWDPSTESFRPTGQTTHTYSMVPRLTLLPDGRVLLFQSDQMTGTFSAEIWDPATETWSAAPAPGGEWSSATSLGDGRLLVLLSDGNYTTADRAAAIWNPLTGALEPTGSLIEGREGSSGTRLPDGRVLVAGGSGDSVRLPNNEYGSGPVLSSAELWDPRTGTFASTGSLRDARAYPTALLLANGDVFIVGGSGQSEVLPVKSAEVFRLR